MTHMISGISKSSDFCYAWISLLWRDASCKNDKWQPALFSLSYVWGWNDDPVALENLN